MVALAYSAPPAAAEEATIYVREYRISGGKKLTPAEAGDAVYPFLGPQRTAADVESARAALEKAFRDKGFQTVTVEVPPQRGQGGIIVLKVVENAVAHLRVKGSRFYDLERIKRAIPSLSPGTVPNFNEVTRDIVALNQWPDRRVTPALRAGEEPGTVDIDLNVEDKLPLHGTVELNNRFSANTTSLRLNASVSYGNLWQLGHAVGFSYLVAPERPDDAEIFSGYYLLRLPHVEGLTLVLQATKQNSNITSNNIGSITVASPGETVGVRANINLPAGKDFVESLSLGVDYKHYEESVFIAGGLPDSSPLSYYPLSATYNATWAGKSYTTDLTLGAVFGLRGRGSNPKAFDRKRLGAQGNFVYLHGDLTHEQKLPGGAVGYLRVHGQLADQPLVNTEQIAGGGLDTVRGYLEAETLGDNGIFGTAELRSPSLLGWLPGKGNEWRIYGFADAGYLTLRETLPEQDSSFRLASVGVGTRLRLLDHLNGSLDLALPLIGQSETSAHRPRITFRVWADF